MTTKGKKVLRNTHCWRPLLIVIRGWHDLIYQRIGFTITTITKRAKRDLRHVIRNATTRLFMGKLRAQTTIQTRSALNRAVLG